MSGPFDVSEGTFLPSERGLAGTLLQLPSDLVVPEIL